MRPKNKYKIYHQAGSIPESFHQRLLNFKRPKWKRIQKVILQNNHSQKSLINNSCIKTSFKNWEKIQAYYNLGLKSKNTIYNYFDCGIGFKHISESLKNPNSFQVQESFRKCIVTPEFRIDILLAGLGFFHTSFQARQSILNGSILVNGKVVCSSLFLKKGDIISFSDSVHVSVDESFKCFSPTKKVFSFLEVDFYSNTLVITKNLSDLHLQDMYLFSVNYPDLKKIKDFL
jgi:ribosomal protein S4